MAKKRLGFKDAISYTLKNKSFLTFVFANLFVQFAFVLLTATIPFYTKYVIGVGSTETFLVLFAAFAAALPMLFLWRKLVLNIGAKNCYIASILLLGLALVPFLLIKTFAAAVIVAAFIGVGLSGILLIWDVIISDIIDEDELRSGVRREGMYFGMNSLIVRFAIAMQAATIGLVLTFSGYQPALPVQPGITILGFRLLIAGIPVLGLVVAFIVMRMYPLFGARLAEVKAELRKRRAP
jgi:GPH family glycoside/pentoside/hexuronide:cation symporter